MVDAHEVITVLRQIITNVEFTTIVANPCAELPEELLLIGRRYIESQGLVGVYGRIHDELTGEPQTVIVISQNDDCLAAFFEHTETMKNFRMMGTN